MFVSSYNVLAQATASQKAEKTAQKQPILPSDKFQTKLVQNLAITPSQVASNPVNYISKNVVLNNKHELEKQQNKTNDTTKENVGKFKSKDSLIKAHSAYESNTKMFSLFTLPQASLNQTPSLENTLPQEPMDIKESNMRHTMVNTYIANDNYYKVTA